MCCIYLFVSIIGNEAEPDAYELHICAKDYCFAREDRLLGSAVLQIRDIMEQVISPPVYTIFYIMARSFHHPANVKYIYLSENVISINNMAKRNISLIYFK